MNGIETLGEAITMSLLVLGEKMVSFLPTFLGALLVFLAGLIMAIALGKLVEKILQTLRIDKAIEKLGYGNKLEEIGIGPGISSLVGGIVKWFFILVFLMAATDILQLTEVTSFLNSIILYIPNVVVAIVILSVVFLAGNFVYGVVKGSTRTTGVMSATLLAAISKWSIVIFGVFAALIQLGIAPSLVSTIFIGIVAMLALAGGLAFGLGGKEEAQLILKKLREEITEKRR